MRWLPNAIYTQNEKLHSPESTRPELSVENIALAHHVSVRTVTRTFARHQVTPPPLSGKNSFRPAGMHLNRGVCAVYLRRQWTMDSLISRI
jgi:hypothetical protein